MGEVRIMNTHTHTHRLYLDPPAMGRHLYAVLGTSTQVAECACCLRKRRSACKRWNGGSIEFSVVRLICPSTPPQFGQRRRRRVAKVLRQPYRAMIDDFGDHHKRLGWGITRPFVPGLSCYHHKDKPTQSPTTTNFSMTDN